MKRRIIKAYLVNSVLHYDFNSFINELADALATQTTLVMGILKYIVFDMDDQYFVWTNWNCTFLPFLYPVRSRFKLFYIEMHSFILNKKKVFVLMFQMFIFTSFTFAKIYFAKSHHVDLSFIVCRCSWDFCYAVEILVNILFYFGHMISTVKSYQPDIMIKPSEFQIIHMGQKC